MKALCAPQIAGGLGNVVDIDPSTNGDPTKSGQLPTLVGTIAAGVYASEPTAGAARISADVQTPATSARPRSASIRRRPSSRSATRSEGLNAPAGGRC